MPAAPTAFIALMEMYLEGELNANQFRRLYMALWGDAGTGRGVVSDALHELFWRLEEAPDDPDEDAIRAAVQRARAVMPF